MEILMIYSEHSSTIPINFLGKLNECVYLYMPPKTAQVEEGWRYAMCWLSIPNTACSL